MSSFFTGDISDEQFEENKKEAIKRFENGERPSYSTGICESVTAGYGRLDDYGYWEYPLPVNQKTFKIITY
jgi:hypothetical protein